MHPCSIFEELFQKILAYPGYQRKLCRAAANWWRHVVPGWAWRLCDLARGGMASDDAAAKAFLRAHALAASKQGVRRSTAPSRVETAECSILLGRSQ